MLDQLVLQFQEFGDTHYKIKAFCQKILYWKMCNTVNYVLIFSALSDYIWSELPLSERRTELVIIL